MHNKSYLIVLGVIFFIEFSVLAIAPHDRADWFLENILILAFVVALIVSAKTLPLSRTSYTCIFVFMILHEVGAHYTYAKVPYEAWGLAWFDFSVNNFFGWERNNFDRVMHFLYGFLLLYPIQEVYRRVAKITGFWSYFFPLELVMASSMAFELFEWAAAEFFGGDLGMAYLGTQGDVWDAHKDMALATLGALIAILIILLINKSRGLIKT